MCKPENKLQKPTCTNCGSDNVTADASARWDPIKQRYELSSEYGRHDCQDCGHSSFHPDWKPLEAHEIPEKQAPICSKCNSPNLTLNADAKWSIEADDWILDDVFDQHQCQDCDACEVFVKYATLAELAS